jgi:hypothetical protein
MRRGHRLAREVGARVLRGFDRQKLDAELRAAGLELLQHVGKVASAQIQDSIAIALSILEFIGQLAAGRGM